MPGRTGSASFFPSQTACPVSAHSARGWLQFASGQPSVWLDVLHKTNALTSDI